MPGRVPILDGLRSRNTGLIPQPARPPERFSRRWTAQARAPRSSHHLSPLGLLSSEDVMHARASNPRMKLKTSQTPLL